MLYELLTGTVPFNGDTTVEIAMKHLSTTPEPPSARRPELPQALDQIVLRALAKDPDERYQTAEEMDAELARVAEGYPVSPETAEAATQVLAGAGAIDTAATAIARAPTAITPRPPSQPPAGIPPYRPPSRGYYYEEPPPRRRAVWPWIVVGLLVLAAGAAVFLAWGKIQDQLEQEHGRRRAERGRDQGDPRRAQAARGGPDRHLRNGRQSSIKRVPSATVPVAVVIKQDPQAGDKVPKGKLVSLQVSTGAPEAVVPDVRGKQLSDAIEALAARGLHSAYMNVPSSKPALTVVAQDPAPGKTVPARRRCASTSPRGRSRSGTERASARRTTPRRQQAAGRGLRRRPPGHRIERAGGRRRRAEPAGRLGHDKGAKMTL